MVSPNILFQASILDNFIKYFPPHKIILQINSYATLQGSNQSVEREIISYAEVSITRVIRVYGAFKPENWQIIDPLINHAKSTLKKIFVKKSHVISSLDDNEIDVLFLFI